MTPIPVLTGIPMGDRPRGSPGPGQLNNGAVVILDALGTKGIWLRETPEKAVKTLGGIGKAFSEGVGQLQSAPGDLYGRAARLNHINKQSIEWKCRTVSDTVVATVRTDGNLGTLLLYVALELAPLVGIGFEAMHPYRGAVSVGDFYEYSTALIGPAVDEAAEWHDQADWAGVILTPSASSALVKRGLKLKLQKGPAFLRTAIPLKGGPIDGFALNWPLDCVSRNAVEVAFSKGSSSIDVARKRANTLAFFDLSRKK